MENTGEIKKYKNIGSANLPFTPEGDAVQYILDGQQRIASLFAALEGLQVPKENKILNFKEIYVDLGEGYGDVLKLFK